MKLIRSAADFARLHEGDVVVAQFTNSSFNMVIPSAGAVVTEVGGMLSHAAIICRECAVPCVTNCANAMSLLADGDTVRVDGNTGTIVKQQQSRL